MPVDGKVVRAGRRARYQSQQEVANATGLPRRTIQRIEHGDMLNPRIDDLMILSSYLGLDPSELLIHPNRGTKWLVKSRYADLQ